PIGSAGRASRLRAAGMGDRYGGNAGWRTAQGRKRDAGASTPARSRTERVLHPAPEAAVLLAGVFPVLRRRRALDLGEATEQRLLLPRQLRRRPDHDANDLVAPATAVQPRQPPAGHPQQPAGLRAGRDPEPRHPVHRRDLDLGTQGRLTERDRKRVVEVRAVTDEARVFFDIEHDHDVPPRTATDAGVALPTQREIVAVRNAGRHLHGEGTLDGLDTATAALRAQALNDLAFALAVGARRDAHELPQHRPLDPPHLARTTARPATDQRRPVLRTRAAARLARVQHLDLGRLPRTLRDLGERQRDPDADVAAPPPAASCPAARAPAAEQVLEAEAAEVAHEDLEGVREVEAAEAARAGARTLHAGVPVPVVRLTLLRIAEDLVRLRRLLEPLLGLLGPVVPIRVILQRELAVRLLDRFGVRIPRNAQDLVVVSHPSAFTGRESPGGPGPHSRCRPRPSRRSRHHRVVG